MVRLAHWVNIPTLLVLSLSGLSIYWAAPVIKIPVGAERKDVFALLSSFLMRLLNDHASVDRNWFYDHFALGSGNLAYALNIHWFCAYLFMAIGLIYWIGLIIGGGYRALLPRVADIEQIPLMIKYYLNVVPAWILRKENKHPVVTTKYNALQRMAYFSVSIMGLLSILTGWAIHKPAQLGWLQAAFGGYDWARLWHFLLLLGFVGFLIPHVVLVVVDGWDTFRSMVVGWSSRLMSINHE